MFITVYVYYHWEEVFGFSNKLRFIVTILVMLIVIAFLIGEGASSVWSNSNRDANVTVNYPIFKQFSAWTGMGYIPSSGFFTNAYGLNTFALDIYYLYIFFTTGYVGSSIMLLFLCYSFFSIVKILDKRKKELTMALFMAILFTGIGQTNMISYTLLPSMINWIIIFWAISPEYLDRRLNK